MVPTWRPLQSGAAQTMASSRVKFALFLEDELRHLHVEKRGRWGMHDERVARAEKVRICVIGFTC